MTTYRAYNRVCEKNEGEWLFMIKMNVSKDGNISSAEFDYIDNNDDMLCMNQFTFDYWIDDAKGCGREDVIYDIKKKPIRTLWKIFTNKYY